MSLFLAGLMVGLLIAAVLVLGHFVRYVSADLDHYTRYLDDGAGAVT